MNTQNDYQAQYLSQKANINTLKQAINEKSIEIADIKRKANETKEEIAQISEQLKVDEFRFQRKSPVIRPSMTLDEFMAQKRKIADMENELPILAEALDYQNKAMNVLQVNLSRATSELAFIKSKIVEELVEQSVDELNMMAGEQLEKFFLAIVVKNQRAKGFTLDQRAIFDERTYIDVGRTLFSRIFGKRTLPDLTEADQHITALIEGSI
jgi:myosin heavy subunit